MRDILLVGVGALVGYHIYKYHIKKSDCGCGEKKDSAVSEGVALARVKVAPSEDKSSFVSKVVEPFDFSMNSTVSPAKAVIY